MIKTVLMDLDDTVLDFHKGERVAIEKTLKAFDILPTDEVVAQYRECNRFCWEALERGEMTRDDVLTYRFELVFEKLGVRRDPREVQSVYERNLANEWYFIEGAEQVLTELSKKYDLYVTSNGTAFVQDRRIKLSGIAKYFKGIYISERVGAHKPSREFFDRVLSDIGAKREETIIIGDSLTSDIQGGINAGIHTCHYVYSGRAVYDKTVPEYSVKNLDEISEILEKI